MRVLVTGGGGFLGNNLVQRLQARGDGVRILARSAYPQLEAAGVECHRGDVGDSNAVRAAVEGVDSVFHVASRVGYWGAYSEYFETNVVGTQNLVQAAQAAGVDRFVYTSTPSVVIGTSGVEAGGDESLPYPDRYLSSYGPTKAEAERFVLAASAPGFQTCALRPHFIFGPGDPQIAPRLVENARKGTIAQVGDGSNLVDVTYIDNVVDAHVLAHDALGEAGSPVAGQAYFLGQSEPVRLWEFVANVLEGLGAPPVKKRVSYRGARAIGGALELAYRGLRLAGEPPLTRMAAVILGTSHWFDHGRAARDFGYEPRIGTEEGLKRLFAACPPAT